MSESIFDCKESGGISHKCKDSGGGAICICWVCTSNVTCFYFVCSLFLFIEALVYIAVISTADFEHVVHEEFHQVMANILMTIFTGVFLSTILLFSQGLGEFSVCLAFCCLNHLFSGMGGGALFVCKNVRIFDVSKNCKNGFRCL